MDEYRGLLLEQIEAEVFRYGYRGDYGGAWVIVKREENGLWYYVRLGHVSESERFDTFRECLDEAYEDIVFRSKY